MEEAPPSLGSRCRPLASQAAGAREPGTKRPLSPGVPAPFWSDQGPEDGELGPARAKVRCERALPEAPPGSTPRPLRAPCRLQLGHDPGLGPRTIGLWAGAAGCATSRAGSLRGELRSTSGSRVSPFKSPSSLFFALFRLHFFFRGKLSTLSIAPRPSNTSPLPPPNRIPFSLEMKAEFSPELQERGMGPNVGTQRREESQAIKPTNGLLHHRNSRPRMGPLCTSTPNHRKNCFPLPLPFVSGH